MDENKESIAAPSGIYLSPGYILPGKTAFVYPANPIRLPDGASANADYRTGFDLAFAKTDKKVTEYPVTEMPPYESNGRPAIGGKVTNNTSVASGEITVVVSYYDNDDQLLGVAEDTIANLNPGESANFRMLDSAVQHHCSWALVSSYKVQATSLS